MKIVSVVGARPNFMKIAPLVRELARRRAAGAVFEHLLVHTGQHYDATMSDTFFAELGIPPPDYHLGIGSGTHAEQVGRTMIEFEKVLRATRPDWVVVVGDVNATCAGAITAKKEQVKLAHIEAGLRSNDGSMPEEINRLVTDRLTDLFFTTDRFADANLRAEGVPEARIRQVGNIMIDTLEAERPAAAALDLQEIVIRQSGGAAAPRLVPGNFAFMTLHRPGNVDDPGALRHILDFVHRVAHAMPVLWTLHPRTRERLREFGLLELVAGCPGLILLEPLGYREMLKINLEARLALTDSGGLQEECCVLGTPCLTLRPCTERPVTLLENGGVSILTGNAPDRLRAGLAQALEMPRRPFRPPLWDGQAAPRIVDALLG